MCATMKKIWDEWWPSFRASWRIWGAIAVIVILVVMVSWFAMRDEKPSEFFIKLIHEMAWPTLLLLLLGYYYRRPLIDLIDRVESFEGGGFKLAARPKLEERLNRTQDQAEKERINALSALSQEALQLLGNLVAVGRSRPLDLKRFNGPHFARGREHLLAAGLAELHGEYNQYYRPTLEGAKVFKVHVETLEEEIPASS